MASIITTQGDTSGGTEKDIIMSNCSFGRQVSLPAGWSKVRVGTRMWITNFGSGPAGTPQFAFGLCSGTTNLVGDASTTYFVGVSTNTATWGYTGTNSYNVINLVPTTKSGSSFIFGGNIATDWHSPYTGSLPMLFFVDITKGTPNYTFNVFSMISANPSSYVSSATFQSDMPLTSPSLANHGFGSAQTLAVNETLSGSLNCISAYWNRSDFNVYLMDIAVAVIS